MCVCICFCFCFGTPHAHVGRSAEICIACIYVYIYIPDLVELGGTTRSILVAGLWSSWRIEMVFDFCRRLLFSYTLYFSWLLHYTCRCQNYAEFTAYVLRPPFQFGITACPYVLAFSKMDEVHRRNWPSLLTQPLDLWPRVSRFTRSQWRRGILANGSHKSAERSYSDHSRTGYSFIVPMHRKKRVQKTK